jgi:alginate O-acetyltransferase complex protein AlgI
MFFITFFPKLVAGPILRAAEFIPQTYKNIKVTKEDIKEGIQIFLQGLVKKVLIANTVAIFADAVFANPYQYSSATIWFGVIAYAIQILCDFSGYTDMAIGIARMLGYDLVKNFDMPYISKTVTEFWRRWHMSLSRWIRDYIYISLGGNRVIKIRMYFNLLLTMLLGGLWHGASWNFVIWGGLHGLALCFDKLFSIPDRLKSRWSQFVGWFVTMIFILVTWVFFRAKTFPIAFEIIKKMFVITSGTDWLYIPLIFILPLVIIAHLVGLFKLEKENKEYLFVNMETFVGILILMIVLMGVLIFMPIQSSPFIYFQF